MGNARLSFDAIFPDCCFGRGQRCVSYKTAYTSAFDFGSLIDEFAFIVGEVNECFFSKARCGSPTRCGRSFLCHKKMVSPNFWPLSHSTGAVHKSQGAKEQTRELRMSLDAVRFRRARTSGPAIPQSSEDPS